MRSPVAYRPRLVASALGLRRLVTTYESMNQSPRDEAEQENVMAGSVNKVILIGNLGADPEIRRSQDGRPIANLRIATSESWRDKTSGERREKTEWNRVVIFSENLCRI